MKWREFVFLDTHARTKNSHTKTNKQKKTPSTCEKKEMQKKEQATKKLTVKELLIQHVSPETFQKVDDMLDDMLDEEKCGEELVSIISFMGRTLHSGTKRQHSSGIKRESFVKLADGDWLNDEIINGFAILLRESERAFEQRMKVRTGINNVLFVNSFFLERFVTRNDNGQVKTINHDDLDDFAAFQTKDWRELKKIVFPINLSNNHWFVIEVNLEAMSITTLDSMVSKDDATEFTKHETLVLEFVNDKLKKMGLQDASSGPPNWSRQWRPSPNQNNCCDCGVHACMNMFLVFMNTCCGLHFEETPDPEIFRIFLFAVLLDNGSFWWQLLGKIVNLVLTHNHVSQ